MESSILIIVSTIAGEIICPKSFTVFEISANLFEGMIAG